MNRFVTLACVILTLSACAVPSLSPVKPGGGPAMIGGVYLPGHNVTEPRPRKSRYLETTNGGVAVLPKGAGLFLQARVIQPPPKDLYITVDYEGPRLAPLSNDMVFHKDAEGFTLSTPSFQSDLRAYADYTVRVRIWKSKTDRTLLDTLVQPVRCYVDTTGPEIRMFSGLTQR